MMTQQILELDDSNICIVLEKFNNLEYGYNTATHQQLLSTDLKKE